MKHLDLDLADWSKDEYDQDEEDFVKLQFVYLWSDNGSKGYYENF